MVSLSRPGANSCSQLSISSKVISWPVCAAMRPMLGRQAGLDAALGFVVGLVVADGVHQVVPFVLIGILLVRVDFGIPDHVRALRILALEGAGGQAAVAGLGDDGHAFAAVDVAGVDVVAAVHAAAVHV